MAAGALGRAALLLLLLLRTLGTGLGALRAGGRQRWPFRCVAGAWPAALLCGATRGRASVMTRRGVVIVGDVPGV